MRSQYQAGDYDTDSDLSDFGSDNDAFPANPSSNQRGRQDAFNDVKTEASKLNKKLTARQDDAETKIENKWNSTVFKREGNPSDYVKAFHDSAATGFNALLQNKATTVPQN